LKQVNVKDEAEMIFGCKSTILVIEKVPAGVPVENGEVSS